MPRFLVLYESAAGLSLFDCKSFNEIAIQEKSVQQSIIDFSLFSQQVKLISFEPFPSSEVSLDTMNNITEGQLSDFMRDYLASVLPDQIKKHKSGILLGISELKLASAIKDQLNVSCISNNITKEILRGIRLHFVKFLDLSEEDTKMAELGLAHGYSRAKVKFNQHGDDNMIISAIQLLLGLEKDLNTFGMRLKEWYSIHFPELGRLVKDDVGKYANLVLVIGERKNIDQAKVSEVLNDEELTKKILEAADNSIGRDIDEVDLSRILLMAQRVLDLYNYKNELQQYLHRRMHNIAPNLTSLIGERMGAQFIMASGSLTNLAKAPASTVQLLGSEKALFNAMKKRKNTPKYGMIFNSSPVQAASTENKGSIARTFANKISIASRIDAFGDDLRSGHLGLLMKDMMDKRLESLKTNKNIEPNLEAMEKAVAETRRYEQNEGAEEAKNEDYVPPQIENGERKHRRRKHRKETENATETAQIEQKSVQETVQEEQPVKEEEPVQEKRHRHRKHSKTTE